MIVADAVIDLDDIVASHEERLRDDPNADLSDALPAQDHPLYAAALRELVRVDMELRHSAGAAVSARDYLARFPTLDQPDIRLDVCFEEFRLRRAAGESPNPDDFAREYGIDVSGWPSSRPANADLSASARAYLQGARSTGRVGQTTRDPAEASSRFFAALEKVAPDTARRLAEAVTQFPAVGQEYHGFQLLDVLGVGAFSKVYLALEDAVDGRCVALKVTGDARTEVAALARLRHTNIVPVYSVQKLGPHQTVCMPFCGAVTLADVLRHRAQESKHPRSGRWFVAQGVAGPLAESWSHLTFVDAALDIAVRLAAGLAHAHDRGIAHRDLKPANVLLSDDGEPLLLDFNLAEGHGPSVHVEAAYVGGTLPYMAPEQLRGFVAGQSAGTPAGDVYAFGLILHELLTGQPTVRWPGGSVDDAVAQLASARSAAPESARSKNPDVSPALAAIIAKCLEPDPARRYPDARPLLEDLIRQRDHLPLLHQAEPSLRERASKWLKRHPRLTSGGVVATAAAVILLLGGLATMSIMRDRAALADRENRRLFVRDVQAAQVALAHPNPDPEATQRGLLVGRRAWERFPESSHELAEERGQLAYLLARAEWRDAQRATIAATKNERAERAQRWNTRAERLLQGSPLLTAVRLQSQAFRDSKPGLDVVIEHPELAGVDDYMVGMQRLASGKSRDAAARLARATQADPSSATAWYARGLAARLAGHLEEAVECFSVCVALKPEVAEFWHERGNAQFAAGRATTALADLNQAVTLRGDSAVAHFDRGLIKLDTGDLVGAEKDVTRAIELGCPETRYYFVRSRIRAKRGDTAGAQADRESGWAAEPVTDADWQARALSRLPGSPELALADLARCLEQFPKSRRAHENRAYIYDAILKKPAEAQAALDEALAIDPEHAEGYASRGVLKARAGDWAGARKDAESALKLSSHAEIAYRVAGIFALTATDRPADRDRALFLLTRAIHLGFGVDWVDSDPELVSLRNLPEVRRLISGARREPARRAIGG